jgi:hypothetical protein
MTRYEFKPNLKKSGRNQSVGSWEESHCKDIELPLTKDSLKVVLSWGANQEDSPYTHQEIAHWCDRFHMEGMEKDAPVEEVAIDIAADVDAQWDLYLVNTFKLEELQKLEFSKIKLPAKWFDEWLKKLNT